MASINIEQRVGKSGAISYRVRVRVTERKKIIDKLEMTFDNRRDAEKWALKAQKELVQKHNDRKRGFYQETSELREASIGELIREYLQNPRTASKIGRTKEYVLRALLKYDISLITASRLTALDLMEHCEFRLAEDTRPKPQTVYHDVTYLCSVMAKAKTLKINASTAYHDEAIPDLLDQNLIGRSNKRTRRLKSHEIPLIEEALKERENHRTAKIPYSDIFQFSLKSAMRIGEITELLWEDLDPENRIILVRSRKDPRKKEGNDHEVPLVGGAFELILKQKENANYDEEKIFPYDPRSITAGWQRILKKIGIKNLRYHDLRREAASQLAELGVPVNIIARVTGHKNINLLHDIYAQVDARQFAREGYDRYAQNKKV